MHEADLKHSQDKIQKKLEEVYALRRTRSKVNWDRDRYLKLLADFGNPHLNLPPVIHVAGTNGKGSIIAMMRSILEAQGLRVHAFTSPHLIDVNERIVLAGQEIENDYLEKLIDQALAFIDGAPLSFFEVITVVGFKAFSEIPADILLLEVGMGGRLDCTNIVENPIATVINKISMDHVDFLGSDIKDIARVKAGIMKRDVPCIIGYQDENYADDVLEVFAEEAKKTGAPTYFYNEDYTTGVEQDEMHLVWAAMTHYYCPPALQGMHQVYNAAAAIMALKVSEHISIDDESINEGLKAVEWRGRLQKIESISSGLNDDSEMWLDVGHNDSAAAALVTEIIKWKKEDNRPVHLIFGLLKTKNAALFLKDLAPVIDGIHMVPVPSDEAGSQSIQDLERDDVLPHDSYQAAIDYISRVTPAARILIAGSMYLIGDVLRRLKD